MIVHPVTYQQILENRRYRRTEIYASERIHDYLLSVQIGNIVLEHVMPKILNDGATNPDVADFLANIWPYANVPVIPEDPRFTTHDLADSADWDGCTCGDPAAWAVGGVAFDKATGRWYQANGQPVTAAYDDVNYRWVDNLANSLKNDPANHPFTVHAQLDQSPKLTGGTSVWKNAAGAVIVKYDPAFVRTLPNNQTETGAWAKESSPGVWDVDVTSSRWVVIPYADTRLELMSAILYARINAQIQAGGAIHYRAYGFHPAYGQVVLFKDWDYPDMMRFEAGSNRVTTYEAPGHADKLKCIQYDYAAIPVVLDDRSATSFSKGCAWRLDISADNHRQVINTDTAKATFIACKVDSF